MANVKEVVTAIKDCYAAKEPLLILGPPGCGKTDLIFNTLDELNVPVSPFNGAALDPSSFGITAPRADNSACDILPTAEFVDVPENGGVFIDELDKLDELVQNTMLPMITNLLLHGRKLSPRWHVFAANRVEDAKSNFEVSPIIRSRMFQIEFDGPTKEEWLEYAAQNNVDYRIQAFIAQKEYRFLNGYDPKAFASPVPRQWMKANKVVDSGIRPLLFRGALGPEVAAEFEVFAKLTMKIPSYDALVATNGNYKVPDDFILKAILASMIAAKVNGADAAKLKPVLDQLPVEFVMLIIRQGMARKASGFAQFIVQNNYVSMMHEAVQ